MENWNFPQNIGLESPSDHKCHNSLCAPSPKKSMNLKGKCLRDMWNINVSKGGNYRRDENECS